MKCAKCQIREAEPGSLYCSKCKKGYYETQDPFYKDYYTFERFYKSKLKGQHKIRALAILDDVLLTYKYYKEYKVFEPVLSGDLSYFEEHKKAEDYFYELFASVLEERLRAVGGEVEVSVLKKQFNEFKKTIWFLTKCTHSNEGYFGSTEPLIIFIRKILRSKNINMDTDFVKNLSNFFEAGSVIFALEFFIELISTNGEYSTIQKFLKTVRRLKRRYGDNLLYAVVDFPIVLLKPWKHQKDAFECWCKNNFNGIIEMATATGKTLLGLMAIQELAAEMLEQHKRGKVLIVSHSRAILNQWKQEVIDKLGLISSGDYRVPVSSKFIKIEFETIQSLVRSENIRHVDLMIIDEVHHIAAPEFRKVFDRVKYNWFMGLSASPDEGYRTNIFKELNLYPPVYRFGLKEAIESGVLPTFDWYLHPVYISEEEMDEFARLSEQIRREFLVIKDTIETKEFLEKLGENPDSIITIDDFVKAIEKARFRKVEIPESWKKLAVLITQRRWLIHRSMPKIEEAIEMAKEYYLSGKKVIVFAMDIETCERIKDELSEEVDEVFVIHSRMRDPYEALSSFKRSKCGILIGAKMLDEGLDIPDAEIGLNVAASKTRIQLIQRLGRILRKHGNKKPVFHHFVGVPHERNFIEFEDPFWILDEVSWVLDTALSMRVNVKLVERDEDVKRLIRKSERKIREYSNVGSVSLPSYGVLKLDKILSQFSESAIDRLVSLLDAMPEGREISDGEWLNLMKKVLKETGVVKGHWWLLVLGDRNPSKIKEILQKCN